MISINRNLQDIHARYKMPNLIIKYEGKNTGVKTILVNLEEISKSLNRNPDQILKYFSYALSLQTKHSDKFIINGKHDQLKMQNLIYDYIDQFVLCFSCGNPETFYKKEVGAQIDKKEVDLQMECLACGYKYTLPNHKLNAEILKNIEMPSFLYKEQIIENTTENEEDLYSRCVKKGMSEEEIFSVLLDESEENLKVFIGKENLKKVLEMLENYIEEKKEYKKISSYINILIDSNIKKNDIFKYYTRPKAGKKRCVEFKKEINKYFN